MSEIETEFDVNRWPVVLTVVIVAAVISAFLLVAPAVVGGLVTSGGFTPAQAGYLLSIEIAAMAVVVPPAFWWMPRWNWRRVTAACLLLATLGNAGSCLAHSFITLAILRSLTGLAAGSVILVCSATIAMTRERERNYGFFVVGQLIIGVIGMKLLPTFIAQYGLVSVYGSIALFMLGLIPLTRWLPSRGLSNKRVIADHRGWADRRVVMGLGAIWCFYIALSAVWAYMERIGAQAGFNNKSVTDTLTLASLFGVAGSFAASAIGSRCGRALPISLGYAILIGSIAGLFSIDNNLVAYTLGSCAFKFAWTFALPFVLAALTARDHTGRVIVTANFLIPVALASGPALAAWSLKRAPDYSGALAIGVALTAASLILVLPLARRRDLNVTAANLPAP